MRDDTPGAALIPIPTEFGGILYRSRTEARWAVFFTVAEIVFQYEPDGFDLGGVRYIADFWLPDWKIFVEVKPFGDAKAREIDKCARLARLSGFPVFMATGDPGLKRGILFTKNDDEPGSTEAEMGRPIGFFAHCRRCPRIVLSLEWRDSSGLIGWGERALFGPCEYEQAGKPCHDRVASFGNGFEDAISAACNFTWQAKVAAE